MLRVWCGLQAEEGALEKLGKSKLLWTERHNQIPQFLL